jgi:hypothetical protein
MKFNKNKTKIILLSTISISFLIISFRNDNSCFFKLYFLTLLVNFIFSKESFKIVLITSLVLFLLAITLALFMIKKFF